MGVTVIGRSISSLVRTQGIGDPQLIYMQSLRDGTDYNLAYIPEDFDAKSAQAFDPVYMGKLYEPGYELASMGYPWRKEPPFFQWHEPAGR